MRQDILRSRATWPCHFTEKGWLSERVCGGAFHSYVVRASSTTRWLSIIRATSAANCQLFMSSASCLVPLLLHHASPRPLLSLRLWVRGKTEGVANRWGRVDTKRTFHLFTLPQSGYKFGASLRQNEHVTRASPEISWVRGETRTQGFINIKTTIMHINVIVTNKRLHYIWKLNWYKKCLRIVSIFFYISRSKVTNSYQVFVLRPPLPWRIRLLRISDSYLPWLVVSP
jgi:hypothetical protein